MPKIKESRAKSSRKPLRQSSNGGVIKPPSDLLRNCHSMSVTEKENYTVTDNKEVASTPQNDENHGTHPLDRLLLIHSDLSNLTRQTCNNVGASCNYPAFSVIESILGNEAIPDALNWLQIDELVAQAIRFGVSNEKERKEIESLAQVLSDIHISLKPWVPRFQKALSSLSLGSKNQTDQFLSSSRTADAANEDASKVADGPNQTDWDSLVSPSPLVSWRAGCTNQGGRQLFLLTPLPKPKALSSKLQGLSKPIIEAIRTNTHVGPPSSDFVNSGDAKDDLLEYVVAKPTSVEVLDSSATTEGISTKCCFISPEKLPNKDCSMVAMTPCLKMSPPKSCILLEPNSEFTHKKNNHGFRASTPYPVGLHKFSGTEDSESSNSETSSELILKYPELVGIKPAHELRNARKVVEASPNWFMSPPKTCVLMEPLDEKTGAATNWQLRKTDGVSYFRTKETEHRDGRTVTTQSCNQVVEKTPIQVKPGSTIRAGKHPGENTLKKELWTKFEAATTNGIQFNVSVLQKTANTGFLDLLEEVSYDETSIVPQDHR